MSIRTEIVRINGWMGVVYYCLFPLDLFGPETQDRLVYQQTKLEELVPVQGWLVPLIVLLTAATSLNWFQSVLLFGAEALILAALTKFHLKLRLNQVVEVWLNLWASMTLFSLVVSLFALIAGWFSTPDIDWD